MKKINANSKYVKKVAFTFKGTSARMAGDKSVGQPTTTTITTHPTVSFNCP